MDTILILVTLIAVYSALTVLFHRGEYLPQLSPPEDPKREIGEAAAISLFMLGFYWLQTVYRPMLGWATSTAISLAAALCLLLVMEKTVRGRDLAAVGFRLPEENKLRLFAAVLALWLVGGVSSRLALGIGLPSLDIYLTSLVIVGPLVEETVFRGLIQTRLEAGLGAVRGWLVSGLLFGFYHLWAHFIVAGNVVTLFSFTQVVVVAIHGMLLGVVFAKTRSLLPPFLLHAVNNFVAFIGWG